MKFLFSNRLHSCSLPSSLCLSNAHAHTLVPIVLTPLVSDIHQLSPFENSFIPNIPKSYPDLHTKFIRYGESLPK